MRRNITAIIATWILICLATSAQSLSFKPKPIVIGAIYNLTGSQSPLDIASYQGAQIAVNTLNAAGGILGRPIKLEVIDGESQPATITEAAEKLANSDASVIIGLSDTDMALAAIPAIASKQKIFITSGATSPKLTSLAPYSVLFACFIDSDQAAAAAEFANKNLHAKNAYIIVEKDMEYAHLLSTYFEQRFTQLDGTVSSSYFYPDHPNITAQLKKLKTQHPQPDVIYAATDPQNVVSIIKQIRAAGFKQPIIGGDSFDTTTLGSNDNKFNQIYFTAHAYLAKDNPDPKVMPFVENYKKTFKQAPTTGFAALGYDTIALVARGISDAKSTDSAKIRAAILNIQNYDGISGTFTFSNDNPVPLKTVTIVKIDNGNKSFVTEWQPKPRLNHN